MTALAWCLDRNARALILFGSVPWLAGLNLAWEAAHVRLYTIWLLLALIAGREGALARWRWPRIGLLTVVFGVSYTVFSEWMNITLLRSWTYADAMPTVAIGGFELGVTPLAQWLVVPPLALYLARRTIRKRNRNEQAPA
jgi:hypothetical protein